MEFDIVKAVKGENDMKLTLRQVKLLQYLDEYPETNAKELSGELQVSLQTLRSELENITDVLAKYDIFIELSSKNNIWIRGRENLTRMLKSTKSMREFLLEQQALLVLIMVDEFVVQQEIADKLYVSKSLIEKLMTSLFKKHPDDFQSLRHYGIRCTLPQLERRSVFVKLLLPYFCGIDFRKELEEFHTLHFPLLQYFTQKDFDTSIAMLEQVQKAESFSFTDESMCQLFLCFLYLQRHQRLNHKGRIGDTLAEIVRGLPDMERYMGVAIQLAYIAGLADDKNEISYICYLLMMLRKQKLLDTQEIIMKMQALVSEILDTIFKRLSINLLNDTELFNGLSLHIYATVLRQEILKPVSLDCDLDDTRRQYPLSFEMAVIVSEIIQKKYNYVVSEAEMVYLMLHLQAAVERMRNNEPKIRTIVVCHYGMAAASLIETRIDRLFSSIKIIGEYSVHNFVHAKAVDCDLVLTTEKIPDCKVPVIYVTPALRENELKKISDFVETKSINKMLELIVMDSLVLEVVRRDVEDILLVATELLQQGGYVNQEYFLSVMERENLSPTDVGGIAIPHGNPNFVNKTKLLIVKLSEPVMWRTSLVRCVFLFAISREQFQQNFSLFSSFYKKLVKSNMKDRAADIVALSENELKKNLVKLMIN